MEQRKKKVIWQGEQEEKSNQRAIFGQFEFGAADGIGRKIAPNICMPIIKSRKKLFFFLGTWCRFVIHRFFFSSSLCMAHAGLLRIWRDSRRKQQQTDNWCAVFVNIIKEGRKKKRSTRTSSFLKMPSRKTGGKITWSKIGFFFVSVH